MDIAEHAATRELALALTAEEERDLEQARADFAHGRTLTIDQFSADMDAFMADLRKQAQVQS